MSSAGQGQGQQQGQGGPLEFPGLDAKLAKLSKPTKKSAFEKLRAEAEAKRLREAEETAAVYEDFVKSFDRDDGYPGPPSNNSNQQHQYRRFDRGHTAFGGNSLQPHQQQQQQQQGPPQPGGAAVAAGGAAGGRRHFGAPPTGPSGSALPKSGPGSLGPPPASFGKKRPFEAFQRDTSRRSDDGRLTFDDEDGGRGGRDRDRDRDKEPPLTVLRAFNTSDDEDEGTAASRETTTLARPTIKLEHLPPGTSPAVIKALIPASLAVEGVKIIPPSQPAGTERKSMMAIVTLAQDTPATEIDSAVSALQNRYLGYGYHLSLHRHLSSNLTATPLVSLGSSATRPFGAKPVSDAPVPTPHAGPGPGPGAHGFNRRFAPPSSFGTNPAGVNRSNLLHVPIRPPRTIKAIRLINRVLEGMLKHGAEFEALLMTRPEVQRDERWAWIWDARSEGGVWYRWRLWEIVTGGQKASKGKFVPLFEGSHAWKMPDKPLPFEYTTSMDEFVSDPDYDSDEEDDFERDGNRDGRGSDGRASFLNPLEKAKLTHLLARLPTVLSRAKKGDIARVTAFAIAHSSRGVDEVVDMVVANVATPYALTAANPNNPNNLNKNNMASAKNYTSAPKDEGAAPDDKEKDKALANDASSSDPSAASLVGLYAISDILSSSSNSGVRHAWRFRQLFETALREHGTFEELGMMADRMDWGRMRADKWKRSVGLVLSLWEGWSVFPVTAHEEFVKQFEEPAELRRRVVEAAEREEKEKEKKRKSAAAAAPAAAAASGGGGGWKKVERGSTIVTATRTALDDGQQSGDADISDAPGPGPGAGDDDVPGSPMEEGGGGGGGGEEVEEVEGEEGEGEEDEDEDEDDVKGELVGDEEVGDVEGEPIEDDDADGVPMDCEDDHIEDADGVSVSSDYGMATNQGHIGRGRARGRTRAVDMFSGLGGEHE